MIHIGGRSYELVEDHKNGWNPVAFRDRYSDVLDRYDYIIGDWGYNQLRLKGFFRDNHPKATPGSVISGIVDYINEYCNFGCAYFVLQKHAGKHEIGDDDIDLDTLVMLEPAEEGQSKSESDEAPVAAGRAIETEEKPPLREHVRAVPKPSQRRSPAPPRKDSQREHERGDSAAAGQHASGGHSHNRKTSFKEKEGERNRQGSVERERSVQQQEKQRHKKQANAELGKAQVAAAAEQPSHPRNKAKEPAVSGSDT
ncbi:YutD family protein [Paenibacillus sp. GCM10027626]|uniref:YutD family protein n=1 Tax=Paenibacillus sp. GCM10027626 TaxID=3273411 RepID=UPI00363DDE7D